MKKFLLLCIFVAPFAEAAELSLTSSGVPRAGDDIKVTVRLETHGSSVNAIEGSFAYPESFTLREIRDGNSVVNFWVERPSDTGTAVRFAGIIPGGYTGDAGELFQLIFHVEMTSNAHFGLFEGRTYLNDGKGTLEAITLRDTTAIVEDDLSLHDTTPPEPFPIATSSDPGLFDGKVFAVFATQDKESGVSHYEIAEARGLHRYAPHTWLEWRPAESPHVLATEGGTIFVRAYDKAGNVQVSILSPERDGTLIGIGFLLAILLLVALIYVRTRRT